MTREARGRARSGAFGAACVTVLLASAGSAWARPQITSGVTTGVAVADLRTDARVAYHLGARGDILLGRSGPRDMAIGPYVELLTTAFETLETGGGVAWLVPAGETAFLVSAGAFARRSRFGFDPGAVATVFWGARSYNYHSSYAVSAGLFAQGRYGLGGEGRQADALVGVQLDLEYLALPFVLAYQAIAR